MPINTDPSHPRELIDDIASERLRAAELLHAHAEGDEDALLHFAAASFALAADAAEAVANLTLRLSERVTAQLADVSVRVDELQGSGGQ